MYFDTDTGSLDKGKDDRQETLDALKAMLEGAPSHQYILKPVTGEARVSHFILDVEIRMLNDFFLIGYCQQIHVTRIPHSRRPNHL